MADRDRYRKMIQRQFSGKDGWTEDFHAVQRFLVSRNLADPIDYDFEWSRWEWAFCLPYLDRSRLHDIGVWEEDGEIVGIATYEDGAGRVYLCGSPDHSSLKPEMLEYAKARLRAADGSLSVLINNGDSELQVAALEAGWLPTQETEGNSVLDIGTADPGAPLPDGFRIIDLTGDIDIRRFHSMLWKGFNHEGAPPMTRSELEQRERQVDSPHMIRSLNSIVVAPDGEYASYCGIWYDTRTSYAMIEPVATIPEYRKLGLGRAAVMTSIGRAAALGATRAYVGSTQQFYFQLGFRPLPVSTFWTPRSKV